MQDILESDCRSLTETVNKQLVRPLERFKYCSDNSVEFAMDFKPPEDLREKAEIIKLLAEAGYKVQMAHIERVFGMPLEQISPLKGE